MRKYSKRIFFSLMTLVMLLTTLFAFSSCQVGGGQPVSTPESSSESSDLPAYDYTYNPYALPEAAKRALGDSFSVYQQAVDAIRAGKESFAVTGKDTAELIRGILEANYVPYGLIKSYDYDADSGLVKIAYRYSANDVANKITEFERSCSGVMTVVLRKNDSDTAKAIGLYYYVTGALYEANNSTLYSAFMEGRASYNQYAEVLSALFLQAGIDCETVNVKYGEEAYLVAAAKLDGTYYYFDPYIECSRTDGKGLVQFGMTTAECKAYLSGPFTVSSGIAGGEAAPESADARYAPLRSCASWSFNENRTSINMTANGITKKFELPAGTESK